MTTQVSLVNMYGLAIASDTLSSMQVGGGTAFKSSLGNSKIWVPNDPAHQIAVYHSGYTILNRTPHRIHVEAWFRTLTKPLATLNDYVESYKKFCVSAKSPHPKQSEAELVGYLFLEMVNLFRKNIFEEGGNPDDKTAWDAALMNEATLSYEHYLAGPTFEKTSITWAEETIKASGFKFKANLKDVFPEGITTKFYNLVMKTFKRFLITTATTEGDSTLTFAGFGDKDNFARVIKIDFRGIVNGKLLSADNHRVTIDPIHDTKAIVYGAQVDAIWGFVQGFRAPVRGHLHKILDRHIPDAADKQEKITNVIDDLTRATNGDYVQPFFRRLNNCSIPELAETANDMLNVQLLSAKLSGYQETVGGTVEVLTIDKANGVRWHNRLEGGKCQ